VADAGELDLEGAARQPVGPVVLRHRQVPIATEAPTV